MSNGDNADKLKNSALNRRNILLGGTTLAAASAIVANNPVQVAQAQTQPAAPAGRKPNILFIMGDDIGWFNVSAYNMGIMGYRTPNIDRIGKEGAIFTDWYGQQSCTAGRAAFITGQSPIRTGLTKVGLARCTAWTRTADPSVADVMKTFGYATGQFGKNHLGDRNEHLPTVHGFDEFFGNLYHLNAEEEPENPDYPKDPRFRAKFGPRGVLKCKASDKDDPTVDPAFGRVGKQVIENTGPLDTKRMETIDEEFLAAAKDFINRQHQAGQAVVLLLQLDADAHLHASEEGVAGQDRPGCLSGRHGRDRRARRPAAEARSTISASPTTRSSSTRPTTAPRRLRGPMAARRRSRARRRPTGRARFRVPCLIRWPGVIKPGTIVNDICAHEDFIPTFAAAAGEADLVEEAEEGHHAERQDVQRPSRRLQPDAVLQGRREGIAARRASCTGATTVS